MKALLTAFALVSAVTAAAAQAQNPPSTYAVSTQARIEYVQHDGVTLTGDLYLPKGVDKAPVVIAAHGGGWQAGSPVTYRHWGTFFAKHGYAVFAISYRLSKPGAKTFPGAVYDVKAAVQFVRANAARFGIDPDRIGLMGDSAGAHLAALVALAGDEPLFSTGVPQRSARRHGRERQVGDRILRRLRHAGAVAARPDHPSARPDH